MQASTRRRGQPRSHAVGQPSPATLADIPAAVGAKAGEGALREQEELEGRLEGGCGSGRTTTHGQQPQEMSAAARQALEGASPALKAALAAAASSRHDQRMHMTAAAAFAANGTPVSRRLSSSSSGVLPHTIAQPSAVLLASSAEHVGGATPGNGDSRSGVIPPSTPGDDPTRPIGPVQSAISAAECAWHALPLHMRCTGSGKAARAEQPRAILWC